MEGLSIGNLIFFTFIWSVSGHPYDVQVCNIGSTSARLDWKTTELSVEEFLIHCAGNQYYERVKIDQVHNSELHVRSQYVPNGITHVTIGDLRPNYNYTCMISERVSENAQVFDGRTSIPVAFMTDYGAPEKPKSPIITKKSGITRIDLFKPSSSKYGPLSGYKVQFHVMDNIFLSELPVIDRDLTEPFGKLSPVTLEYAQKVSQQPISFQVSYGNDLPSFIEFDEHLMGGALKNGAIYRVVTVVFTKRRDSTITFTPSEPSDSFVAVGNPVVPAIHSLNSEVERRNVKILLIIIGLLPPICLLYALCCCLIILYKEYRGDKKKEKYQEASTCRGRMWRIIKKMIKGLFCCRCCQCCNCFSSNTYPMLAEDQQPLKPRNGQQHFTYPILADDQQPWKSRNGQGDYPDGQSDYPDGQQPWKSQNGQDDYPDGQGDHPDGLGDYPDDQQPWKPRNGQGDYPDDREPRDGQGDYPDDREPRDGQGDYPDDQQPRDDYPDDQQPWKPRDGQGDYQQLSQGPLAPNLNDKKSDINPQPSVQSLKSATSKQSLRSAPSKQSLKSMASIRTAPSKQTIRSAASKQSFRSMASKNSSRYKTYLKTPNYSLSKGLGHSPSKQTVSERSPSRQTGLIRSPSRQTGLSHSPSRQTGLGHSSSRQTGLGHSPSRRTVRSTAVSVRSKKSDIPKRSRSSSAAFVPKNDHDTDHRFGMFKSPQHLQRRISNVSARGQSQKSISQHALSRQNRSHATSQHATSQHAKSQHAKSQHAISQRATSQHAKSQYAKSQHAKSQLHLNRKNQNSLFDPSHGKSKHGKSNAPTIHSVPQYTTPKAPQSIYNIQHTASRHNPSNNPQSIMPKSSHHHSSSPHAHSHGKSVDSLPSQRTRVRPSQQATVRPSQHTTVKPSQHTSVRPLPPDQSQRKGISRHGSYRSVHPERKHHSERKGEPHHGSPHSAAHRSGRSQHGSPQSSVHHSGRSQHGSPQSSVHHSGRKNESQHRSPQPSVHRSGRKNESQHGSPQSSVHSSHKKKASSKPAQVSDHLRRNESQYTSRPAQDESQYRSSSRPAQDEPQYRSLSRPAQDESQYTRASSRPAQNESQYTRAPSKPAQDEPQYQSSSRPAQDESQYRASSRPAQDESQYTRASSRPAQDTHASSRPAQVPDHIIHLRRNESEAPDHHFRRNESPLRVSHSQATLQYPSEENNFQPTRPAPPPQLALDDRPLTLTSTSYSQSAQDQLDESEFENSTPVHVVDSIISPQFDKTPGTMPLQYTTSISGGDLVFNTADEFNNSPGPIEDKGFMIPGNSESIPFLPPGNSDSMFIPRGYSLESSVLHDHSALLEQSPTHTASLTPTYGSQTYYGSESPVTEYIQITTSSSIGISDNPLEKLH